MVRCSPRYGLSQRPFVCRDDRANRWPFMQVRWQFVRLLDVNGIAANRHFNVAVLKGVDGHIGRVSMPGRAGVGEDVIFHWLLQFSATSQRAADTIHASSGL